MPPPTPPPACRRARLDVTYTSEDGSYSFSVPTAFPLRLVLRVYARDDRRVAVRDPIWGPYVHKTEPVELSPGAHRLDVVIEDEDLAKAFFIYDTLTRRGWEELMRRVGWAPDRAVNIYWPLECLGLADTLMGQRLGIEKSKVHSCYTRIQDSIPTRLLYLIYPYRFAPGPTIFLKKEETTIHTILHELGHFVMDSFTDYARPRATGSLPSNLLSLVVEPSYTTLACPGFNHNPKGHTSPSCAWSEGWASFLAAALLEDPDFPFVSDGNLEHPERSSDFSHPDPAHPTNADSEWAVAAALWDLYDDLPEPWDRLADGLDGSARNGIWTLATQATPSFFLNLRIVLRESPEFLIPLPTLEGDRDGVEAFWAAWKAQRPETVCEAGRILTAHFIPHGPYPLTVHAAPPTGGTVSVEADRKCEDGTYPEGETVRLRAQPNPGWTFAGWIGADAADPDGAAVVSMPPPQVSGGGFSLVEVNPHYFELGSCALGRTCVLYRYQRADPISSTPTVDLYLRWSWNPATISDLGAQEPWVKIMAFGGQWDPTLGRFDIDPAFQGVISGTVTAWGWGATTRVDDRYRRIILELNQGIGQGVERCAEWGGLADQAIPVICPVYGTVIEGTYAGAFSWGQSVTVWGKVRVGTDNPAPVEAAASIRIAYHSSSPPIPPPTPTP